MVLDLSLEGFRSFSSQSFVFNEGLNVICGPNGSGKSSLLEAIHLLAYGRSFRTQRMSEIIQIKQQHFLVRATTVCQEITKSVALMRDENKTSVMIMGNKTTLSNVVKHIPALFVDSDSYRKFMGSAQYRRRLLDWLVFHVEPEYLECYRRYQKLLDARNACLKSGVSTEPWDVLMPDVVKDIHEARQRVFEKIIALVRVPVGCGYLESMTGYYHPGYDSHRCFLDCLKADEEKQRRLKRTTVGPHVADWGAILATGNPKSVLSQGQQKTAYFCFVSAMDRLLIERDLHPILLVDDCGAELDGQNQGLLKKMLLERQDQSIVTSLPGLFDWEGVAANMFHVEPCVG